jgi:sugar phosphate isomerase/epimerase
VIGLGSYAFFWAHRAGLGLDDALRRTADLGVTLFQICDHPPVDALSPAELRRVRALAERLGVRLQLGTRGLAPEHLRRQLAIATELGCTLLRSMVDTPVPEARRLLRAAVPALDAAGVTLALETYERVSTAALVELVAAASHPRVGICLDPGNTVARLEHPGDVIELAAPYAVNVHVKDFAFARAAGQIGFTLAGAPLGEGLLDRRRLLAATPRSDHVVEHWLPPQEDLASTVALERDWTIRALEELRSSTT